MTYRLYDHEKKTAAFGRTWIVNAPWAHPMWKDYVVLLYDLTTEIPGHPPTIKYRDDVTHEFMMFALDPAQPVEPPTHMLWPANHAYQFKADSDEQAEARIVQMLDLVAAKKLSPDTDFRLMWDSLLLNAVSLHGKGGGA